MLFYKNILIAVDGSKEAEWAFNKAIAVAKRNDAKLNIATVIDTRSFASIDAYERSISERASRFANDLLNRYKNAAEQAGVKNIELFVDYGSPKSLIPKTIAKNAQADLIMCGATGLNAVERFFMGSVSENIVRFAPCDVLVVRTNTMPADFEPTIATKEFLSSLK